MKTLFIYGLLVIFCVLTLARPAVLESANLTTAKDALQSSRLSVYARVDATGTLAGSSNVKIQSSASAPANTITTANINVGDLLTIGASTSDYYTVVGIVDSLNFTVSPVLNAGDADNNDVIYLKSRPRHAVTFKTASAVANGFFQVLLPADTTTPNDGNPDDQGYDFNTTVDVTAPTDVGSTYDFVAGVATASGATGCTAPAGYHCFEVHYSGLGAVNQTFTLYIGNTDGTNTPISPAPVNTTEAAAETYPVIIKNFAAEANPNTATAIDQTSLRVAHIESVRVTATVDPTISMTICGDTDCSVQDVDPGDIVDGETLSNNTGGTGSGTAVALGALDLLAARLQAQKITIATNGSGGYALTAADDGNLRKGTDTIDDNVTPPTSPAVLNTPGTEAYGIHPCGTHVSAATWGTGSDSCAGGPTTNEYSGTDATTPLTLVSYTTGPTAGIDTYIIYKANISTVTPQGDYAHAITYTATATF